MILTSRNSVISFGVLAGIMNLLRFTAAFTNSPPSFSRPHIRLFSITQQNIGIVGGGLAGLSTAYHLIEKLGDNANITIFDQGNPGTCGASSVAGG